MATVASLSGSNPDVFADFLILVLYVVVVVADDEMDRKGAAAHCHSRERLRSAVGQEGGAL